MTVNPWREIAFDPHREQEMPTWDTFAERFDRCFRRIAPYVRRRVGDRGTVERIVTEALETNLDLLFTHHDELVELRRLRATANQLIATSAGIAPGPSGAGPG